jgi:hypothetical protein
MIELSPGCALRAAAAPRASLLIRDVEHLHRDVAIEE